MIRVLLVEDSDLMRKALARFMDCEPDIQLVGEASSFKQAIALADTLFPEIVLLDVHLRDDKSVTTSQVKLSFARCRVIAMSIAGDAETQRIADAYGAIALLDKMTLASELTRCIKRCAENLPARMLSTTIESRRPNQPKAKGATG